MSETSRLLTEKRLCDLLCTDSKCLEQKKVDYKNCPAVEKAQIVAKAQDAKSFAAGEASQKEKDREEIDKWHEFQKGCSKCMEQAVAENEIANSVARKEGARELMKWANGLCKIHGHRGNNRRRLLCTDCWQSKLKDLE